MNREYFPSVLYTTNKSNLNANQKNMGFKVSMNSEGIERDSEGKEGILLAKLSS